MFTTLPPTPTRPIRNVAVDAASDPWLTWSIETPDLPPVLSVAEMADCRCPDLCDRDHANE
jgi:hypothetical protein